MTDYNSDQGRELRRVRLVKVRPTAAPDMLSKQDYTREYREFQIVRRGLMPDVEERARVMFCPACHEAEDDELVRARKLHVSYDEDPLRNYRALVTVACKGCGWREIIPVESPPPPAEEEMAALREAGMQSSPLRNLGQSDVLNPQLWGDELKRQYTNPRSRRCTALARTS